MYKNNDNLSTAVVSHKCVFLYTELQIPSKWEALLLLSKINFFNDNLIKEGEYGDHLQVSFIHTKLRKKKQCCNRIWAVTVLNQVWMNV